MQIIAQTQVVGESVELQTTTLTGTAEIAYRRGAGQVIVIENKTGSSLNPVIVGSSAPNALSVSGYGELDLTGGFPVGSIAAGVTVAVPLDSIYRYLAGQVIMSGAIGAVAYITTKDMVPTDAVWIQNGRLVASGRLTATSRLWG